jgi:hypothetical protein
MIEKEQLGASRKKLFYMKRIEDPHSQGLDWINR